MQFKLTKLQATEIGCRLQVAVESQTNEFPEDRLPVWGTLTGDTLTVFSTVDAMDEIENIIDRLRDPAHHWNKMQTMATIRSFQQLQTKMKGNQ